MRRILWLCGVFLTCLGLLAPGPVSAITVTATPPSVNVGSNVLVTVSSDVAVSNPCSLNVSFGDASSTVISCAAGSVCTGNLNHVYSVAGNYTITATESGTCMAVCGR